MVGVFKSDRKRRALGMTYWGAVGAAICVASGLGAAEPKKLKVLRQIPHSGYSEGLDFHEGFLWRALPKAIAKISPQDGSVLAQYTPPSDYSESVVWVAGAIWNVSYSDNGLYRGERKGEQLKFKRVGDVPEIHAWGIAYDGKNLIVTGDYSSKLYFFDPKTAQRVRTLETDRKDLEDLAWDGTGLWTSSFTQYRGKIFRIDPQTGKSSDFYLLPDAESCPVIDGIARDGKTLWITGKHCPSIYQVELPRL